MGYPQQLRIILGIGKLLGAITLVVPGLPKLKEWAYSGLHLPGYRHLSRIIWPKTARTRYAADIAGIPPRFLRDSADESQMAASGRGGVIKITGDTGAPTLFRDYL